MNSKRAINFDLSTVELKKLFSNTAEAYNQIKTFMLAKNPSCAQKIGNRRRK